MKVRNQHERMVAAPPERITALFGDFGRIWPTQLASAPRLLEPGVYQAGVMVWEEFDRPGAAWAFRVATPPELQAEHWFSLSAARQHRGRRDIIRRSGVLARRSGPGGGPGW